MNKKRKKRGKKKVSKILRISPELREEYTKEFATMLAGTKSFSEGKINYAKILPDVGRKATIYMTPEAYFKMLTLLSGFDKEVAWHGVAHRYGEDIDTDEYIITDILVYPQTVTGVTVDMDEAEYANWLMENADDERFDNLRMQGHSHVRMGTTPSTTDIHHQETILDMLGGDDFYIFMIYNKNLSKTVKIFDLKKNIMFDNADIDVAVLFDSETTGDEFLKDAKRLVVEKSYVNKYYNPGTTPAPKSADNGKTSTPALTDGKDGKKSDGTGAKNKVSSFNYGSSWGGYDYEDDEDDGYGAFGYSEGCYRGM